jgi:hypothetical protein
MPTETTPENRSLRSAAVTVPAHVVYRAFPSETVVLNLNTGKYHGLNPTAGHMLEAMDGARSLADAATVVATEYGVDRDVVERDMCGLCRRLLERGLVEADVEIEGGGAE